MKTLAAMLCAGALGLAAALAGAQTRDAPAPAPAAAPAGATDAARSPQKPVTKAERARSGGSRHVGRHPHGKRGKKAHRDKEDAQPK
jgi:hypothetical protein